MWLDTDVRKHVHPKKRHGSETLCLEENTLRCSWDVRVEEQTPIHYNRAFSYNYKRIESDTGL